VEGEGRGEKIKRGRCKKNWEYRREISNLNNKGENDFPQRKVKKGSRATKTGWLPGLGKRGEPETPQNADEGREKNVVSLTMIE